MKKIASVLSLLLCAGLLGSSAQAETRLRMSTTTSTDNSGLLAVLLPPFETQHDMKVDVIAVGTGKALKLGENGDVDVVFVHARPAEDKFVADGYGVNRRDVMHNDFVVVGPKEDPSGLQQAESAAQAFRKLSEGKTLFISRGDDSGTHKKERTIWKAAGISPLGDWYSEAGQGMGAVLQIADEKRGYALSDRGTFIAYGDKLELTVLYEGDPILYNPYGIIAVNPARHPHVNYAGAMALIAYVTGREGQKIIEGYKMKGKQLFYPDAVPNP
jgi:tungstate transport system substrate-binding protein